MYCTRKVTDDIIWVGANDRRRLLFEGVYSIPEGVSYNSYLVLDEKTVLFDTVDRAVQDLFLENVQHTLDGRPLDYLILQHIEPDHSAAVGSVLTAYPGVTLVVNERSQTLVEQFYGLNPEVKIMVVKEFDTLETGKHTFTFVMAPMVHWPEVMMTYESASKTLFSADAFGCFGALNGALFADEVDYKLDYMDRTRRYYTNIVGKYGPQVQSVLKKAATLDIQRICPLHGFVWRKDLREIIAPHDLWSRYEPEETGVMIAYASVYSHTENAAEMLAVYLREKGIKTVMHDVSVVDSSVVVAESFRWSHLVFASTTYNSGIFIALDAVIEDLVSHNIQKRHVAIIENGSWAPNSGNLIREKLGQCQNMTFVGSITINSRLQDSQRPELEALAQAIADTIPKQTVLLPALQKLPYGLFVLSAKDGEKDDGCIINTVSQQTATPERISVTVNKSNLTHDMIEKTGEFAVSILTESTPFDVFKRFGFASGRDVDKFGADDARMDNGLCYLPEYSNAALSAKVVKSIDVGTHTIFVADMLQSLELNNEPSCTYGYYFAHIKPAPAAKTDEEQAGYECTICGYLYEGDTLPDDFVCPLCKHGAADFRKL